MLLTDKWILYEEQRYLSLENHPSSSECRRMVELWRGNCYSSHGRRRDPEKSSPSSPSSVERKGVRSDTPAGAGCFARGVHRERDVPCCPATGLLLAGEPAGL